MLKLTNEILDKETAKVEDYKACFITGIKIKEWLKNKAAYSVTFNQLGFNQRAFVIKKPNKHGLDDDIIINPTWRPGNDTKQTTIKENCLSYPGKVFEVERFYEITVNYYSPRKNKFVTLNLKGLPAVIFQHEIDHLDGIILEGKEENTNG